MALLMARFQKDRKHYVKKSIKFLLFYTRTYLKKIGA